MGLSRILYRVTIALSWKFRIRIVPPLRLDFPMMSTLSVKSRFQIVLIATRK